MKEVLPEVVVPKEVLPEVVVSEDVVPEKVDNSGVIATNGSSQAALDDLIGTPLDPNTSAS